MSVDLGEKGQPRDRHSNRYIADNEDDRSQQTSFQRHLQSHDLLPLVFTGSRYPCNPSIRTNGIGMAMIMRSRATSVAINAPLVGSAAHVVDSIVVVQKLESDPPHCNRLARNIASTHTPTTPTRVQLPYSNALPQNTRRCRNRTDAFVKPSASGWNTIKARDNFCSLTISGCSWAAGSSTICLTAFECALPAAMSEQQIIVKSCIGNVSSKIPRLWVAVHYTSAGTHSQSSSE